MNSFDFLWSKIQIYFADFKVRRDRAKEKVHIVGNGWAAYYFAKTLDKAKYIPIIIAPNSRVLATPKLANLAVDPNANVEFDNPYAEILLDWVNDIDFSKKLIHCQKREPIEYSHLVIAIGSEVNDFNIPGVREYTLQLKTIEDAKRIYERLLKIKQSDKECIINVIGSGPTGVELSSKMRKFLGFEKYEINIIEGLKKILPGFTPKSQEDVTHYLTHHNQVNIFTNDFVSGITAEHVLTTKNQTKYPYDLIIWTGGVRFNGFNKTPLFHRLNDITGKKISPRGITVKEDFSLPISADDSIYCIGDMVANMGPPTAQNAKYQAKWLGEYFNARKSDIYLDHNPFLVQSKGKALHFHDRMYIESDYYNDFVPEWFDPLLDLTY
jgi:NADH dehydrogenase FAD-containing subunit